MTVSEAPKADSKQAKMEELQQEFNQLCYQSGNLQYQIDCLNGQLGELNVKMRNVNTTGAKLKKEIADEQSSNASNDNAGQSASEASPITPSNDDLRSEHVGKDDKQA